MEKEDLVSQMKESQEQFRKQFDPQSQSYHKGDQTVVPLGGERIPESMPTTYPQQFDPNKGNQQIDYGQQYQRTLIGRQTYLNLKKVLAKLCPILEAFLRHQNIFKQKGDPNNQKHLKTHQQHIQKQKENLAQLQSQLSNYLPLLENIGEQGKLNAIQLKLIIEDSNKKYPTKEALAQFNFKVKKISTKIFADAQKCLQKIKDIKKEYNNKQKQQKQEIKKQ